MEKGITKRHSADFKAKILQEVRETRSIALVARTHGLVYQTVAAWIRIERKAPKKKRERELKEQELRLKKLELENRVLKELLKKTNQAWLSDEPSPTPSFSRAT
jgi:transposase-like protein